MKRGSFKIKNQKKNNFGILKPNKKNLNTNYIIHLN